MGSLKKHCTILIWLLSLLAKNVLCTDGQGSKCGLDNQGREQMVGPTEDEILKMVKDGLSSSLQNDAAETSGPGNSPTLSQFLQRRKRSFHQGFTSHHPENACPAQNDQSKPYVLRSDPTGFPTELIAAELFQRSLPGSDLLFQCLARTTIDEDQGPIQESQPFLEKGTTCPQSFQQLWTYNSVKYGNVLCWALSSFQESILYASDCQGKPCLGCSSLDVPFSYDFSITYQKQCLPRFRAVSLWGFCPSLPVNQRIVWDRIVIPVDCSCATVSCKQNHFLHG